MLRADDVEAAVAEGIVTAEQAAALRDLAARREHARAAVESHEERFRFMRGFNDFFFALGIVMLAAGLLYFVPAVSVAYNILTAIAMWAIAELLVRRMRLVLPGILLALLFVLFVFRAMPEFGVPPFTPRAGWVNPGQRLMVGLFGNYSAITLMGKALIATATAALFYARFRLPFALLLVAAGLVIAVESLADHFGLTGQAGSLITLACGLAAFAAAMTFDLSDRERMTRRADCAFWLHLLAAPLIVHSLIALATPGFIVVDAAGATSIAAVVAALTLVAIVIDRRALLVSALSYLGAVIAFAIATTAPGDRGYVFFATLLVLGVTVLALGVGWQPLRRALIHLVPSALAARLPPVAARA